MGKRKNGRYRSVCLCCRLLIVFNCILFTCPDKKTRSRLVDTLISFPNRIKFPGHNEAVGVITSLRRAALIYSCKCNESQQQTEAVQCKTAQKHVLSSSIKSIYLTLSPLFYSLSITVMQCDSLISMRHLMSAQPLTYSNILLPMGG